MIWCCESLRSPQFFWQKLQCVAILPARVSMQAPQCGRVLDLCTAGFAKTVSNRIKPLIQNCPIVRCSMFLSPKSKSSLMICEGQTSDRQDKSDLPHPPTTNHHKPPSPRPHGFERNLHVCTQFLRYKLQSKPAVFHCLPS